MSDPKRILIAGDFHGNQFFQGHVYQVAQARKADAIVQLGDWGYWPTPSGSVPMVDHADVMFRKTGIPLYWLDGNHEHFDMLEAMGLYGASGMQKMQDGLFYLPRGTRWEWNGTKFLAFGGAYSIDKAYRTPHVSWFSQELPTYKQVDDVLDNPEPVDIMFSHDSPRWPGRLASGYKDDATSEYSRQAIRAIVDHVNPATLYHGHYHHPWQGAYKNTRIVGLDCDGAVPANPSWDIIRIGE